MFDCLHIFLRNVFLFYNLILIFLYFLLLPFFLINFLLIQLQSSKFKKIINKMIKFFIFILFYLPIRLSFLSKFLLFILFSLYLFKLFLFYEEAAKLLGTQTKPLLFLFILLPLLIFSFEALCSTYPLFHLKIL